jgi:hypothetical protein
MSELLADDIEEREHWGGIMRTLMCYSDFQLMSVKRRQELVSSGFQPFYHILPRVLS